jgi:hypothetical protein
MQSVAIAWNMRGRQEVTVLVQDFKTGHITMSSPRSMFLSQIAGALMGESAPPSTQDFQIQVPRPHIQLCRSSSM